MYHCDNDVPDHQTLLVAFADGLQATFTVHGHATHELGRGEDGKQRDYGRIDAEGNARQDHHGQLQAVGEQGERELSHQPPAVREK